MPPSPPPRQMDSGGDWRQIQIIPASSSTVPFKLPEDWIVELRPRSSTSSGIQHDKYYYEPGTGRQFRSLISIKRYLNGEEDTPPPRSPCKCLVPYQNSGSVTRTVYDGKNDNSFFVPDGWIVEEIARRDGFRSDRYFIEPDTGRKFRSVPEVHRYLSEDKLTTTNCQALLLSNHAKGRRSQIPRKKKLPVKLLDYEMLGLTRPQEEVKTSVKMLDYRILDLANPPEKVKWVYSGDGKDKWSPVMEGRMLPDYVKEQWHQTFLLGMNTWKRLPQLTMGGNN